jgi:hypothetical protein
MDLMYLRLSKKTKTGTFGDLKQHKLNGDSLIPRIMYSQKLQGMLGDLKQRSLNEKSIKNVK